MSIVKPRKYTREELEQAAAAAAEHFKHGRYNAEAEVARFYNEAFDKAYAEMGTMFGELGVVGGCVLQGVFAVDNLVTAQEGGVSIFWSADLKALTDFALSTR